jgi:hypothetical protein
MKLNFWQWLGVALLAIGLILYVIKKNQNAARPLGSDTVPPATLPAAATSPTSAPR